MGNTVCLLLWAHHPKGGGWARPMAAGVAAACARTEPEGRCPAGTAARPSGPVKTGRQKGAKEPRFPQGTNQSGGVMARKLRPCGSTLSPPSEGWWVGAAFGRRVNRWQFATG